jgi:hypothetical protein
VISDNETWLIDVGDTIIRQRATRGEGILTRLDRLIYCLWVADYGMRNAGDLIAAYDLCGSFHNEGSQLSQELGLTVTHSAFALSRTDFEQQYFRRFEAICDELRAAQAVRVRS